MFEATLFAGLFLIAFFWMLARIGKKVRERNARYPGPWNDPKSFYRKDD